MPGTRTGGAETEPHSDPESVARLIGLQRLDRSPQTRAQLADAMRRRGVPEESANRVLDRFEEVGLVDDAAFADAWVQSRHAGRGLARRALAAELGRRGVAPEVIEAAVGRLDSAQEERAARAFVAARLAATRGLDPQARTRRLVGQLARRGYPAGMAMRVVREALAGTGEGEGDLP